MAQDNPFLGARPYGPQHRGMFFGREVASLKLAEQIQLHPLVMLVAPSGIGKTSLLRASVLPSLEKRGLSPVYMRPDPVAERDGDCASALLDGRLSHALATALLPDPALEIGTVKLIRSNGGPVDSLTAAADWFAALDPGSAVRRDILTPPNAAVERSSMIARYLSGSFARTGMAEQWRRIDREVADLFAGDASLGAITAALRDDGVLRRATARRAAAMRGPAGTDAAEMVRALTAGADGEQLVARPDGADDLNPRIVLVIDQFEQLFTLSIPETRAAAFAQLIALLDPGLQVHLVLALRKEWYADVTRHLSAHMQQRALLDRGTHHLEPMTKAEALEVMVRAPATVGQPPIPQAERENLWATLQVEEAVDAVVLSIACYELFTRGADTAEAVAQGGVEGLLAAYLQRALEFDDPADHDEALDILGEIAGMGVTREFVTRTKLLSAPLRDKRRRGLMLDALQRRFVIRGDRPKHNMDQIFDIMHERLLDPIRVLVGQRSDLIVARAAAERVAQPNAVQFGLDRMHCRAILAARGRLTLDPRAAGIVLRTLIEEVGTAGDGRGQHSRDLVEMLGDNADEARWTRTLAELSAAASVAADDVPTAVREATRWWMTADEVKRRTSGRPDPEADWLALASVLRGPADQPAYQMIRLLARRVGA